MRFERIKFTIVRNHLRANFLISGRIREQLQSGKKIYNHSCENDWDTWCEIQSSCLHWVPTHVLVPIRELWELCSSSRRLSEDVTLQVCHRDQQCSLPFFFPKKYVSGISEGERIIPSQTRATNHELRSFLSDKESKIQASKRYFLTNIRFFSPLGALFHPRYVPRIGTFFSSR